MNVSDPDGYTARVQFYVDGLLLGTATAPNTNSSATYQLQLLPTGQGPLTLTAVATDNYGRPVTSAPVILQVTNSAPSNPVATGLKVWLSADSGLTTTPGGAVLNWTDRSGSGNTAIQPDESTRPHSSGQCPQWQAGPAF